MFFGMATRKITITLPEEQLDEIRSMVASGQSASVSAFVQHAVKTVFDDAAGWRAMLAEALEQTGGPLTKKERDWADGVLSRSSTKRPQRKRRAA
jgi:Arc/MetJ-type ribon-helix-helix transcriptional regulator